MWNTALVGEIDHLIYKHRGAKTANKKFLTDREKEKGISPQLYNKQRGKSLVWIRLHNKQLLFFLTRNHRFVFCWQGKRFVNSQVTDKNPHSVRQKELLPETTRLSRLMSFPFQWTAFLLGTFSLVFHLNTEFSSNLAPEPRAKNQTCFNNKQI